MSLKNFVTRQYGDISSVAFEKYSSKQIWERIELKPSIDVPCKSVIGIDVDSSEKFILVGENDGTIRFKSIPQQISGQKADLQVKRFYDGIATRVQWFPHDTGMLCISYTNKIFLIDTNTLTACESYKISSHVYWSDWSAIKPNLIAAGLSSSTVRLIDIRSGNSLQNITFNSQLGNKNNCATRVHWDPLDGECLFIGDSSGFIHLFDIRSTRKSMLVVTPDDATGEPVTCLMSTKDKMHLVTCHGASCLINMWSFKDKLLQNTHISYERPLTRRKVKFNNEDAKCIKYQLYLTDDYLFVPTLNGRDSISINNLWSGVFLRNFNCENSKPIGIVNLTTINGTSGGCLFSGGRRSFKVWTPVEQKSFSSLLRLM